MVLTLVLQITPLDESRINDACQFVCEEFVANSALHQATNVVLDDYLSYMRVPFLATARENLSFIATNSLTGALVACLLAGEFRPAMPTPAPVPEGVKPIKALLLQLEQNYWQQRPYASGAVLLVDIAVVSNSVRRQGVYTKLRHAVHQAGIARGYGHVVGELSSAATQHLCVHKLGHKILSEIEYRSFSYNGTQPFESIQEPKSIQLVEGALNR